MPAPEGMMRRLRTTTLVVAVAAILVAVAHPATAAADLGDLLQIVPGGGSDQPEPGPPPADAPDSGGPQPLDRPAPPPRDPLLAPESACPGQSDPRLPAAAQRQAMVCAMSYARQAKGLPSLRPYKPLRISATHKARDLRRCQTLSHKACGRNAWYWIIHAGFFKRASLAGELLAAGRGELATVRATIRSWLDSKMHRAALLHPGFDLVGVATLKSSFRGVGGTRIWVTHLGFLR